MKRREAQKEMEDREEAIMRKKRVETEKLFLIYQKEKEKQRNQDAQALSAFHLRQAVSYDDQVNKILVVK